VSVAKKLSAAALSTASPTDPIQAATPAERMRRVKAGDLLVPDSYLAGVRVPGRSGVGLGASLPTPPALPRGARETRHESFGRPDPRADLVQHRQIIPEPLTLGLSGSAHSDRPGKLGGVPDRSDRASRLERHAKRGMDGACRGDHRSKSAMTYAVLVPVPAFGDPSVI
jgi:hypothetical protein